MLRLILVSCLIVVAFGQQREQSECERMRERAQKSTAPVVLVPNCETNGEFSGLQCHRDSRFCQCWRRDGTVITQPSTKIRSCDCIRRRDEHDVRQQQAGRPIVGAMRAQCEENGSFTKKQCHPSTGMCWCVDSSGERLANSEPSRGEVTCN